MRGPERQRSFSYYLIVVLVVITTLVISVTMMVNYTINVDTIVKQQQMIQGQVENNLVKTLTLIDTGRKNYEATFDDDMKVVLESVTTAYDAAGSDPSAVDLEAIKQAAAVPVDINLINASGVVEYSTNPANSGLDFRVVYPYYADYLEEILPTDGFYPDRAVMEYQTGDVIKFATMPTHDHRYVAELLLRDPALEQIREELDYESNLNDIAASHKSIMSIRVFASDRRMIFGNSSPVPDTEKDNALDQIFSTGKTVTIDAPDHRWVAHYIAAPLPDPSYIADMDQVVEVTYDTSGFVQHLHDILMTHIFAGLGLVLLSVGIILPLSFYLTAPFRQIAKDVNIIADGDLDHSIRATRGKEFAVLEQSINQMVDSLKQSIRDHRSSEERYRAVVEGQDELILRFRPDGTCLFANEAFCRYFGLSCPGLPGTKFQPAVHDDDLDRLRAYLATFDPDHPAGSIEHRVLLKDGSVRCTSWTHRAFFDAGNSILEFQAVGRDITDRKLAQEALRESEERFRSLIEGAPIGIVLLRGPRILYANPRVLQSLRIDPERPWQYRSFLDFIAPGNREEMAERNRRRMAGGQVPDEYETVALRTDGTVFPTHVDVTSIELPDGKATLAFLEDITERKEAEAEISRLYAEMEQRVKDRTAEMTRANQEMEAFSYSVSHDLQAPLRAIEGFSAIFTERFGASIPADGQEYIRKVRESTVQMAALINALLELSRLGRQELKKEDVDPSRVVQNVRDQLRQETANRKVEISVGDLPPCRADPVMLHQVYFNLLSNALKFTRDRDPAVIVIGSTTGPGGTVYFVRDNGVGFDMQYAGDLFKPFHRLHNQDGFDGTGIGLALVGRIIDRHGGRIWVESAVGKGTTFFFTIPGEQDAGPNRDLFVHGG